MTSRRTACPHAQKPRADGARGSRPSRPTRQYQRPPAPDAATRNRVTPTAPQFQRDRARVIHSRAFRRLEYKTQVFLNGTGDHLRTRLTHTIEVASISRTIARALGLNEDLAEAIALAHDLGHPPFGHPGEETLDRLMAGHGGFDHNAQSLRIVELIESNYPDFPGLNLSFEVTEGLRKHQTFYDPPPSPPRRRTSVTPARRSKRRSPTSPTRSPTTATTSTTASTANLIESEQLAGLALWQDVKHEVCKRNIRSSTGRELCAAIIRRIIDRQVEDVVSTSASRIDAAGVRTVDDVRRQPVPLIAYGHELLGSSREMRGFLFENLYYHPEVACGLRAGVQPVRATFSRLICKPPERLGQATAARMATGRVAPDGVRLPLRHDRPLFARRTRPALRLAHRRVGQGRTILICTTPGVPTMNAGSGSMTSLSFRLAAPPRSPMGTTGTLTMVSPGLIFARPERKP